MKKLIIILTLQSMYLIVPAQNIFITKNGHIGFYMHTAMEDVKADYYNMASIINIEKGDILFIVNIEPFKLDTKSLEKKINEKFTGSNPIQKIEFTGKIISLSNVNFKKDGNYSVELVGNFVFYGINLPFKTNGVIGVKGENLVARANFNISLEKFGIILHDKEKENIQDNMQINVDMVYMHLNN
jgi:hypothetical protein